MRQGRRLSRLRISVPIILLFMILMRLIWMQLRSYPQQPAARALMSLEMMQAFGPSRCATGRLYLRAPPPLLQPATTADADVAGSSDQGRLGAVRSFLASPGFVLVAWVGCVHDMLDERAIVRINEILFSLTVFTAMVMTRFMCSSWTIALIVAATLLSRGRLLAGIGAVSDDYLCMLLVTTWLTTQAHFLRTGARISQWAGVLVVTAAVIVDRTFLILPCVQLVLLACGYASRRHLSRPVLRRMRGSNRRQRALRRLSIPVRAVPKLQTVAALPPPKAAAGGAGETVFGRYSRSLQWLLGMEFPVLAKPTWQLNYGPGGLLKTLDVPLILWLFWRRRAVHLAVFSAGQLLWAVAVCYATLWVLADSGAAAQLRAMLTAGDIASWVSHTWSASLRPVDLHLALSLLVVAACLVSSPANGLPSFYEWSWLNFVAIVLLIAAAGLADRIDLHLLGAVVPVAGPVPVQLNPRPVLLWLEPAILSFGVAGLYDLMKVLDTRIAQKS